MREAREKDKSGGGRIGGGKDRVGEKERRRKG